jgi:LemA protein
MGPIGWLVLGVVVLFIIVLFNSLTGKKNQVEFAFASIDVQLKKRFDLIPNLVASCEKYMGYEEKVLKELTEARSQAMSGGDNAKVAMDGKITSQLRSVFALAENYPDLKAMDSFTTLQMSLNEVEEQLSASRRAFNAAVTDYNNAVQMFPSNIAANIMGYKTRTWFEAAPEEREAVKIWR